MPKHRTPTEILRATGAIKTNPARHASRASEPVTPALFDNPPSHLRPEVQRVWTELVQSIAPGVLQSSDGAAVEVLAELLTAFRCAPDNFPAAKLAQVRMLLGEMGATPAARSRVMAPAGGPPGRDSRAARFFDH